MPNVKVGYFISFFFINNYQFFIEASLLNQDFKRLIYIERFHFPFLKGGENDAKSE